MKERIAIMGAGQIANQVISHIISSGLFDIVGLFDDNKPKDFDIKNIKVLGSTNDIQESYRGNTFDKLLVTIGYSNMALRSSIFKRFEGLIPFANFIHPNAFIDASVKIGENVIVYPGCVVDVNCEIGSNVLMNCGCVISHDSGIGETTVLAPRVTLSGFCSVGNSSFLGTATTVIDSITIGNHCYVGAGSLILKDIADYSFGYGTPFQIRNVE